jgi:HD-GYP domain-containing protein (c-di-GMP phosphodiesterase class II)
MENDLIRQAPKSSADLLSNIPRMEGVARAILYQEKGFDGSGFPLISEHNSSSIELTADQIPLTSRVLKILLDISQMSTQKSPHPSVFDQLRERASLYDPKLLKLVEEVLLQTPPSQDQEQTLDVSLFGLRVGDEIVRPIKLKSGQLALGAAQRLSAVMLEKLKHFHRLHGVCEPIAIRRELERA